MPSPCCGHQRSGKAFWQSMNLVSELSHCGRHLGERLKPEVHGPIRMIASPPNGSSVTVSMFHLKSQGRQSRRLHVSGASTPSASTSKDSNGMAFRESTP